VLLWPLIARLRRVVDRGVDGTGGSGSGASGPGGTGGSGAAGVQDDPYVADRQSSPDDRGRELHDSTPGSSSPAPTRKEPES